jgi:predicted O-linked N-acetylglucosamine transferase (SPINDLY family)
MKFEKSLLKTILSEKYIREEGDQEELTSEQKTAFMKAVSEYHNLGESIYRNSTLREVTETLREIAQVAEQLTLSESEHWFDNVTTSRHMKQMNEAMKVFEKTASEVHTLQQRLESAYEDMGTVLNKYYKVNEALSKDGDTEEPMASAQDEDLNISAKAFKKMNTNKLSKLARKTDINIDEQDGECGSQTWPGHEKKTGKSLKSKTWHPAGKSLKKGY